MMTGLRLILGFSLLVDTLAKIGLADQRLLDEFKTLHDVDIEVWAAAGSKKNEARRHILQSHADVIDRAKLGERLSARIISATAGLAVDLDLGLDTSFFAENYKSVRLNSNGKYKIVDDGPPTCFFKGRVKAMNSTSDEENDHKKHGRARVSLCDKVRGVISLGDKKFELHFAKHISRHVLVDIDDHVPKDPFECGVHSENGHEDHEHEHDHDHKHDHHHHHHDEQENEDEIPVAILEDLPGVTPLQTAERLAVPAPHKKQNHHHEEAGNRALSSNECSNNPDKQIGLIVFNDHTRYEEREDDVEEHTASIFSLVYDIYYAGDDAYFGSASEGYGLYDADYVECYVQPKLIGQVTWRDGDPSDINYAEGSDCSSCGNTCSTDEVSVACLLDTFSEYALETEVDSLEDIFDMDNLDNVQLLSGRDFSSSTVGYAGVSSMCMTTSSSGINQATSSSITFISAVISHEMGHNLGMQHDSSSTYIMSPSLNSDPSGTNVQFSTTSKEYANDFFTTVYGKYTDDCLDDGLADDDAIWDTAVCGDGIVDSGEECDPGLLDDTDECCGSPLSDEACQLIGDCECSTADACCTSDGLIADEGTLCRDAVNSQCDVAEYCDGESADCPNDLFSAAGTECDDAVDGADDDYTVTGSCYQGDCMSQADDCTWSSTYIYPCDAFSSCSISYCRESTSSSTCWTMSEAASDGVPCDADDDSISSGICISTGPDSGDDETQCVDASTIKFYHFDSCDCYDEEGTLVDDDYCTDSGVEEYDCGPTKKPTNAPTPRPTTSIAPTGSATPKPTVSPTASCENCCSSTITGLSNRYSWGTFTRLDDDDDSVGTCCSSYCAYQESTYGFYLQYVSYWDKYFVTSTAPCYESGRISYYDTFSISEVCGSDSDDDDDDGSISAFTSLLIVVIILSCLLALLLAFFVYKMRHHHHSIRMMERQVSLQAGQQTEMTSGSVANPITTEAAGAA